MLRTLDNFEYAKKEITDCLIGLIEVSDYFDLANTSKILGFWNQKVSEGRFLLLVIGDFSRGKSTLINALLGEEILPTKMVPTTGTINVIKYGDEPKAFLTFKDRRMKPKEVSFDEFRKLVTIDESEDDSGDSLISFMERPVKQFDLFYPIEICKKGIEIVDSPGLNDIQGRTEITIDFIPKADAAIVVLTAETLLAKNELDFIEDLVKSGFKNFFFIVNFWDQVNEDDDEAQSLKDRAKSILTSVLDSDSLRIFFLSARQALRGKAKGDKRLVETSGFIDFEKTLEQFLVQERGTVFLRGVADVIKTHCKGFHETISQQEALINKTIEELEIIREDIEPQIHALKEKKESIIKKIEKHSNRVRTISTEEFDIMIERLANVHIRNASREWASDQKILLTPSQFKKCIENYVFQADQNIRDYITEWADKVLAPFLKEEIDKLCKDIGNDARDILALLSRIDRIIKPDLKAKEFKDEDPVGAIERLITGGTMILLNPISGLMGAVFGARPAIENFGLQIVAGILLSVLGALNIPALLAAGIIIAIFQAAFKFKSTKERIRDNVVEKISESIMSEQIEIRKKFNNKIEDYFKDFSSDIERGIDTRIDEKSSQLNKIIEDKKDKKIDLKQKMSIFLEKKEKVQNFLDRVKALNL